MCLRQGLDLIFKILGQNEFLFCLFILKKLLDYFKFSSIIKMYNFKTELAIYEYFI